MNYNLSEVIEYCVDPTEYTYSDIVDNFLFLLTIKSSLRWFNLLLGFKYP